MSRWEPEGTGSRRRTDPDRLRRVTGEGPSAGLDTRSTVRPGPVVPRRDAAPRRRAAPATPHPVARPPETITRAAPVKAPRRRRRRRDAPWAYVRFVVLHAA